MNPEQTAIAMSYYTMLLNHADPRELGDSEFMQTAWRKAEQLAEQFEQEAPYAPF